MSVAVALGEGPSPQVPQPGQEEAEKWIANLIKNAQLNAKIDSQAGTIIMHMEYPDLYDRLQSTIKDATSRTTALAHSILGTGESAAF